MNSPFVDEILVTNRRKMGRLFRDFGKVGTNKITQELWKLIRKTVEAYAFFDGKRMEMSDQGAWEYADHVWERVRNAIDEA